MKCKDCKWYVPDEPPRYNSITGRTEYRRCALLFEKLGWMGSCKGSHKYCFEPKDEVNERC